MQAVAAEFSGCAEKFYCFLEREEFKTRRFDSFICKTCSYPDAQSLYPWQKKANGVPANNSLFNFSRPLTCLRGPLSDLTQNKTPPCEDADTPIRLLPPQNFQKRRCSDPSRKSKPPSKLTVPTASQARSRARNLFRTSSV